MLENLHGIAYSIENAARSILGGNEQRDTFYDADHVEAGSFFEVILFVLRMKLGFGADLRDFSANYAQYLGMPMSRIPEDAVLKMKREFDERWGG